MNEFADANVVWLVGEMLVQTVWAMAFVVWALFGFEVLRDCVE